MAKVVLNETVDFACELITARGVAPQAFLTRTEGQVLQAHLVARPVNYDSDGTNKDECLQTLFTGKRAASSEEMGNIQDKLSLTKEQKNYTNATFGANRRRRKAEYFYNWNCPNAKSVDDNTLIKQVSWFESDDK